MEGEGGGTQFCNGLRFYVAVYGSQESRARLDCNSRKTESLAVRRRQSKSRQIKCDRINIPISRVTKNSVWVALAMSAVRVCFPPRVQQNAKIQRLARSAGINNQYIV